MRQFILSLLIVHVATLMAQRQWTLDECMDYAIVHNKELRHLRNEQRRRQVSVQASKDARLPQFHGDMGGYAGTIHHSGDNNKFDANASLLNMGIKGAVPLYTGNRLSSSIRANEYALMAVGEDVRSAVKDVKVQVAAAYLQLLYNKGEVVIARQRHSVSTLLLKRANALFNRGKRPKSEVAEAEAMVSCDEALLKAAEGDMALAKLELEQLLNMPDTVAFDICELTGTAVPDSLPPTYQLYTRNTSQHPAVQSANYSILQAEQGVKTARSGYAPTLSLVGEVGTACVNLDANASHNGQTTMLTPWGNAGVLSYRLGMETEWKRANFLYGFMGLKLSVPIFNAFETRARIRTAKVNLEDARQAYDDAQQQVRKKIQQAWQGAVTAHKRYVAEAKAVKASALSYRYILKRYHVGMATFFDISQIHQQWFAASENALRMKYEWLIRKRILDIQVSTDD